jgi:hypothetical protein
MKRFCRGPGGGFLEKSPLAVGDKKGSDRVLKGVSGWAGLMFFELTDIIAHPGDKNMV